MRSSDIIIGTSVINKTIAFGEYIGQHNNGNHATLYRRHERRHVGDERPVPVVDHNGNFQGWATFHVISADQGGKQITGATLSAPTSTSD